MQLGSNQAGVTLADYQFRHGRTYLPTVVQGQSVQQPGWWTANPTPDGHAPVNPSHWMDSIWFPARTEWSQGRPPGGLGGGGVANELFARTNADVAPHPGMPGDGWNPLYNEKWVQRREAKQKFDWSNQSTVGAWDLVLNTNIGTYYHAPGQPYVLNWEKPPAHHPLLKRNLIVA